MNGFRCLRSWHLFLYPFCLAVVGWIIFIFNEIVFLGKELLLERKGRG